MQNKHLTILCGLQIVLRNDLLLFQKDKKVPTIVPPDTNQPLAWICSRYYRQQFGVHDKYVFSAKNGKKNSWTGYSQRSLSYGKCVCGEIK